MTESPTALAKSILNCVIERNLQKNGGGPPMGSDTQRENETEISHMQRSASLHMRETLRPVPLPRSKSHIEPVSKASGWSQRCQDQQKTTQGAKMSEEEEDEEKEPCTPLLPIQSSPQPPSPHTSASALPLPPPPLPPPPRSGQIPLYMEILPKESRPPELSNLERSTSLRAVKPKPPTSHHQTVHRSKSDSEPVFQKLASFFLSRDQQKANRGAKKPLDNCNQNRRPVRPPPPNISKSRGDHKPLLPIQMSTGGHLNSSDTQDGDGESSLKMLEGDGEKEPCTPLLPGQRLPQPPSPRSSVSALPLRRPPPPPLPPIICVPEQGQIPLYLETLPEKTRPNEKPLDNCNRNQRPLRPPPPNFSKSRGGHKPLLQIQMSTVGPLNSSDTQDGDGQKMFEKDDDEEKGPCTPILPSQSLPQLPSSRSSASALPLRRPPPPPPPPIICVSEQGQIPLYLEIIPEETRPTEVSHLERSTSLLTHKPEPPTPVHRFNSHSELLFQKLALLQISQDQQKANQGETKPLDTCHRRPRPERPPTPNFTKNRGGHKPLLPIQMSTGGPSNSCDTQYNDSKTPPAGFDTENEDSKTPPAGLDTENEDSKTPPSGFYTENQDSKTPPAGLDTKNEDSKTPPSGFYTENQDSKTPPSGFYTENEDSKTPPAGFNTQYEDSKPPPTGFDTENEDSKTSPAGFDTENEDSKTPPAGFDTENEDSKTPPAGFDTENENSKTPPAGFDTENEDSKTPPAGFDTENEDSKIPSAGFDTENEDSKTHPASLDIEYENSKAPPGASDTQYDDKTYPVVCDNEYEDRKTPQAGFDTQYEDRKNPRAGFDTEYEDSETFLGACDAQYEDSETFLGACDTQYEDSETFLGACDTQYEDSETFLGACDTQYEDSETFLGACDTQYEDGKTPPGACDTQYEGSLKAIRSKVVHDFFTKRPVPPVPQSKSQSEPLYEELGSCVKNEDLEERKPEDIEVLMAWWRTVEEWDNMPLDYELKEEEEMRVFSHTAYRIKMGLRLFICLLSKNSESLQNHIIQLKATADNFDKARKRTKIAAITGGTTGAVGSVAAIAGLVFSPLTLGASLVVSAVGMGVATAGGLTGASAAITNKVNHNLDKKRVEKIVLDYWNKVSDIKRCLHFVCMGMGWLGQQDTSRLRVTDEETVAVARLVEVASGISSSMQTTCQSLEMLQKFSLDMNYFFPSGESQKVKKGTETKFANKIRSLAQLLQDGLNSLLRIRANLTLAACTAGVYDEPRYC